LTSSIARLIARARARLEATRLLKAGSRGILAGSALGLAVLVLMKAVPTVGVVAALPWALLAAGAVGAAALAAARPGIRPTSAALYLDEHLGTEQRIVTLLSCREGPFVARIERELEPLRGLPRLPFPREAALVPAALFLVFAAGLLPAAAAEPGAPSRFVPAASPTAVGEGSPLPDLGGTVEKMAAGGAPAAEEMTGLREVIDRALHRPEDRRAAQEALERASGGDAAASKELAGMLETLEGGSGSEPDGAPATTTTNNESGQAVHSVTAYPEARDFLLEYRRKLSEEMDR
jgi:hypothetical protein